MDFQPIPAVDVRTKIPIAAKYKKRGGAASIGAASRGAPSRLGSSPVPPLREMSDLSDFDNPLDTYRSEDYSSDSDFQTISHTLAKNLRLKVHQKKEEKHRIHEHLKLVTPRTIEPPIQKYRTDTGLRSVQGSRLASRLSVRPSRAGSRLSPRPSRAGSRLSPRPSRAGSRLSPRPSRAASRLSRAGTPNITVTNASPGRQDTILTETDIKPEVNVLRSVTPELRKSVLNHVNRRKKLDFIPSNATPAGRAVYMGSRRSISGTPATTRRVRDTSAQAETIHVINATDYNMSLDTRDIREVNERIDDDDESIYKLTQEAEAQTMLSLSPQKARQPQPTRVPPVPIRSTSTETSPVSTAPQKTSVATATSPPPPPRKVEPDILIMEIDVTPPPQPPLLRSAPPPPPLRQAPPPTYSRPHVVYTKPKKHTRPKRAVEPIVEDEIGENYGRQVMVVQRKPKRRSEILTDSRGREYLLQSLEEPPPEPRVPILVGTNSVYHVDTDASYKLQNREREESVLPFQVPFVPRGQTLDSESYLVPVETLNRAPPPAQDINGYAARHRRRQRRMRDDVLETNLMDQKPTIRPRRGRSLDHSDLRYEPNFNMPPSRQYVIM